MVRDIQIAVDRDFVRVTYRGDVEYQVTTDMLRDVAELAAEKSLERLLFDLREANYRDYHLGTIRHAEEALDLGIRRSYRIAILGAADNPMLSYIEAVGANRGFWARAFSDEGQAIAWLHES